MTVTLAPRFSLPDPPVHEGGPVAERLSERFEAVRAFSQRIVEPLTVEDQVVQTMPDVSPTKWHLAHTSWFFERFILERHEANYAPFHPRYNYLFNSYYQSVGPMHCRPNRGLLSRPTVAEVNEYRRDVERRMLRLLDRLSDLSNEARDEVRQRTVLGLHHEQQHQELMVTDIKHVLSSNPLLPAYHADRATKKIPTKPAHSNGRADDGTDWLSFDGGVSQLGLSEGEAEFAYDNEFPRHKVYLQPYRLASRPVSNGEFLAFIRDGGYERHNLWLALGWGKVQESNWVHPIYWYIEPDAAKASETSYWHYTMRGPEPVRLDEPVCHLSYFEADAFARWAGARLPTEAEWEHAAARVGDSPTEGDWADTLAFHPAPPADHRFHGGVWEWTQSSYAPYPGYQTLPGALGEYNGKFMCNQYVLRGGSCATHSTHYRPTYRNFFDPTARWQFSGLRLARDA